jgi:hypothetical protein
MIKLKDYIEAAQANGCLAELPKFPVGGFAARLGR